MSNWKLVTYFTFNISHNKMQGVIRQNLVLVPTYKYTDLVEIKKVFLR
jgi:hypothetical protein